MRIKRPSGYADGTGIGSTVTADDAPFLAPPVTGGNTSVSISHAGLSLDSNGASGTKESDTTGMKPCGYNLRIHVEDRTIRNSRPSPWRASDIEGFGLEAR